MTGDTARLLQEVKRARGDFESRADELEAARDAYYRAVSRLHDAGVPLREIADELGLSHQRVHQMIGETDRKQRRRKAAARAARVAGAVLFCLALVAGGWTLSRTVGEGPGDRSPTHEAAVRPDQGSGGARRFHVRFDPRDHVPADLKKAIRAMFGRSSLLQPYPMPLMRRSLAHPRHGSLRFPSPS